MVKKEGFVYLCIGRGSSSKDLQIKHLTEEILDKKTRDFNSDAVYGRELALKDLQEKLLFYPVKSQRRLLIIREADRLKDEVKNFLLDYLKKPKSSTALILDVERDDPDDDFLSSLKIYSHIYSFPQERVFEAFDLVREIEKRRPAQGLMILSRLLSAGVKPEFILGALRFVSRQPGSLQDRSIMRLLISCDRQIKTGRLKPAFALEKLVVGLCSFPKSAHQA